MEIITFEKESISIFELILTVAFNNIQVFELVVQEVNLEPQQDDIDQTPTQVEAIVFEEQTQQPQQLVPLH